VEVDIAGDIDTQNVPAVAFQALPDGGSDAARRSGDERDAHMSIPPLTPHTAPVM